MGCKYSEFSTGMCAFANQGIEIGGCNEEGVCVVEDDEDPSYSCEEYESNDDE